MTTREGVNNAEVDGLLDQLEEAQDAKDDADKRYGLVRRQVAHLGRVVVDERAARKLAEKMRDEAIGRVDELEAAIRELRDTVTQAMAMGGKQVHAQDLLAWTTAHVPPGEE